MRQTGVSGVEVRRNLPLAVSRGQDERLNGKLFALQIFLAFVFLLTGGEKLFDDRTTAGIFEKFGTAGHGLRYLVGTIEVFGAVTLWNPQYGVWGALLLSAATTGAILARLFIIGDSIIAPIFWLILLMIIVALRRSEIKKIFSY